MSLGRVDIRDVPVIPSTINVRLGKSDPLRVNAAWRKLIMLRGG